MPRLAVAWRRTLAPPSLGFPLAGRERACCGKSAGRGWVFHRCPAHAATGGKSRRQRRIFHVLGLWPRGGRGALGGYWRWFLRPVESPPYVPSTDPISTHAHRMTRKPRVAESIPETAIRPRPPSQARTSRCDLHQPTTRPARTSSPPSNRALPDPAGLTPELFHPDHDVPSTQAQRKTCQPRPAGVARDHGGPKDPPRASPRPGAVSQPPPAPVASSALNQTPRAHK